MTLTKVESTMTEETQAHVIAWNERYQNLKEAFGEDRTHSILLFDLALLSKDWQVDEETREKVGNCIRGLLGKKPLPAEQMKLGMNLAKEQA